MWWPSAATGLNDFLTVILLFWILKPHFTSPHPHNLPSPYFYCQFKVGHSRNRPFSSQPLPTSYHESPTICPPVCLPGPAAPELHNVPVFTITSQRRAWIYKVYGQLLLLTMTDERIWPDHHFGICVHCGEWGCCHLHPFTPLYMDIIHSVVGFREI